MLKLIQLSYSEEMKSNASGLEVPGYFLFNARTEYNFSLGEKFRDDANATFFLVARNITDESITEQVVFLEKMRSQVLEEVVYLQHQGCLRQSLLV